MALNIIDLKSRLTDSMKGIATPIQEDRQIFRDGVLQKIKNKNPKLKKLLEDEELGASLDYLIEALIEATAEAVADEVIYDLRNNAEVAFAAGSITGADAPGGDTHDALIASGGTVS